MRPRSSSQGSQAEAARVLFGSEPDLRFTGRDYQQYSNDSPAKLRISRSRKKYKAPPAPQNNGVSISPKHYISTCYLMNVRFVSLDQFGGFGIYLMVPFLVINVHN